MKDQPVVMLILLGSLALLARVGAALHAAGISRSKNAAAAALRSIVELAVAALAFWAVGAAILLGNGNAWAAFSKALLFFAHLDHSVFAAAVFFWMVLITIATMPISPALAERSRMLPVFLATVLAAAFVIPLCGYWAWNSDGWLARMGFVDKAGACVFHVTAGMIGLVGAFFVRPRQGKYNTDGSSNMIPGHNVPLAAVGIVIMVFAWVPYVVGATLLHGGIEALAAINVLLAGSAALIVSFGMSRTRYGKPDILLSLAGLLGGLVSIAASAGIVNPFSAVAIGAVAGWLVITTTVFLDMTLKLDDPSGLLAAYLVGGAWGTIAVGIFAPQDRWLHRIELLGVQALGIIAMATTAALLSAGLFALFRAAGRLRVSEAEEFDGLDLAQHDLNAYPDFQQTMIKSYHLREA